MKMHLTLLFLVAVAVVVLACLDSAEAARRKEDVVFDQRGNPTRVSKEGKATRRLSITEVNEQNLELTLRRYCLLHASSNGAQLSLTPHTLLNRNQVLLLGFSTPGDKELTSMLTEVRSSSTLVSILHDGSFL